MSHPYVKIGASIQNRAIPNTAQLTNQAKSQHCDDRLTLSSPHHISFPIQRGIVFVMASRRFTVDSAKKKEFINIFLLMPESSVLNAMKQAKFTEEDIADLQMRRFLQRALPGGSIKGLKAYIAGLLPPPPDRRQPSTSDCVSKLQGQAPNKKCRRGEDLHSKSYDHGWHRHHLL